jgi:hypothetical protein
MSDVFPKICSDCKHSRPESDDRDRINVCMNGDVIAQHPWALANNRAGEPAYPECHEERKRKGFLFWQPACGIKGKLWEVRQ